MSNQVTYRQCELAHQTIGVEVAWLPNQFARKGKWLKIGETDGWRVTEVYGGTTLTAEEMQRRRENLMRFKYVLGD